MNRQLIAPAALVVVVLALCGLHIARFTEISVLDEFQHIDYAERLSRLQLPAPGSLISAPTLREDACRGHQGLVAPPCDAPTFNPREFPGEGYNSALAHPPGYYALAGLTGRLVDAAPVGAGFVVGARLASAVFLAAGVLALWWLLGLLGVDPVVRFTIALLPATMPTVLHAGSIVTPDATAILFGAGVPAVAIGYVRGRLPAWVLLASGAALGLSKVTNLFVIGVLAVALAVMVVGGQIERRRAVRCVLLTAGSAFGVYLAWTALAIIRDNRPAGGMPVERLFKTDSLPAANIWANLDSVFPPAGPVVGDRFAVAAFVAWAIVVGWLLIGSTFLGAASHDLTVRGLGWGALVTAVLAGPFLVVFNFVVLGQYFAIDARYGIVLVPTMLAGLAVTLQGTGGRIIGVGLAACGVVACLVAYGPAR